MNRGNIDMSNVYVICENTDYITRAGFFGVGKCGVGFFWLFLNGSLDCVP